MCSELLRIPITYNSVPLFGFGVVLLIWLAAGGLAMWSTARNNDWNTALKAHLPTILIVAGIIIYGIPRMMPDGVPLRSYGLLVLTGIVLGIVLAIHRALQSGLTVDDMLGLALWLIPCGAIGGRLFYVIEYWDSRIRQPDMWATIKNVLAFTEGGLVVFGAFAGAMAGFFVFTSVKKLPALALADLIAPSMLVGLCLGRIGCLMNGCCYGGESHVPWAITFPEFNTPTSRSPVYEEQASEGRFYGFRVSAKQGEPSAVVISQVDAGSQAEEAGLKAGDEVTAINGEPLHSVDDSHLAIYHSLVDGHSLTITTPKGDRTLAAIPDPARSLPVHPAQIYSSIDAGLLAWVLWTYYPFRKRDGEVLALMLMLHPISRFLLEAIRVDEAPVWGTGLSISQNLSVLLFAMGAILWLALRRSPRGSLAFPLPMPAGANPS